MAMPDMNGLFGYGHLPEHLKDVSREFNELAGRMMERPRGSRSSGAHWALEQALTRLWDAKNYAVLAAVLTEKELESISSSADVMADVLGKTDTGFSVGGDGVASRP